MAKAVKKSLKKQQKLVAFKTKKATPTVLKAQKALAKAKARAKSTVKAVLVVLIEEGVASGVAVTRRTGCAINLLTCYK